MTANQVYVLLKATCGKTVEFQHKTVPDPATKKKAVIQYIGQSSDCRREDGTLDPDIGDKAYRGDWLYSYSSVDPSTGEESWHWEILMHNGQIVEVESLAESNWMLRQQDEGYRVYLVNPYDDIDPDTGQAVHYNRGWYQICEKMNEEGKSYSPKRYQWARVNDVWVTALVDPAWLEYSRTNEGKEEGSANTLSVITEEDQCTVEFKGVYSEAFLRNNPNEGYHYTILTGLPAPVESSRKRYEVSSLSPYMAANLEVELTSDGTQYKVGDRIYIKNSATRLTTGILGEDWAREYDSNVFNKAYNIPNETQLNLMSTRDKGDATQGILRIPSGAIPVSSIDITLTYDYDDKNFGA